MGDSKTVSFGIDLYNSQARDVEAMRNSLLSFNRNDPMAARKAIQNVTILRIYHQLSRIVRFTEMMDKIEDRIYQSIDAKLENSEPDDDSLWFTLIPIQERLQKVMVESHKLLEPYLNMEQLATFEVEPAEDPTNAFASMILDQESREKVRTSAQEVLAAISAMDTLNQSEENTSQPQENTTQSKAAEVLAKLESEEGDSDA